VALFSGNYFLPPPPCFIDYDSTCLSPFFLLKQKKKQEKRAEPQNKEKKGGRGERNK